MLEAEVVLCLLMGGCKDKPPIKQSGLKYTLFFMIKLDD